jgi:hypothetical protein
VLCLIYPAASTTGTVGGWGRVLLSRFVLLGCASHLAAGCLAFTPWNFTFSHPESVCSEGLTCNISDCLLQEVWGHLDSCHLAQVEVAQCRGQTHWDLLGGWEWGGQAK